MLKDNASCHGTAETIPDLNNLEVLFLPPNTTSCVQPLDAGAISAIKRNYRRCQVRQALDLAEDQNGSNLYKIDQKQPWFG